MCNIRCLLPLADQDKKKMPTRISLSPEHLEHIFFTRYRTPVAKLFGILAFCFAWVLLGLLNPNKLLFSMMNAKMTSRKKQVQLSTCRCFVHVGIFAKTSASEMHSNSQKQSRWWYSIAMLSCWAQCLHASTWLAWAGIEETGEHTKNYETLLCFWRLQGNHIRQNYRCLMIFWLPKWKSIVHLVDLCQLLVWAILSYFIHCCELIGSGN